MTEETKTEDASARVTPEVLTDQLNTKPVEEPVKEVEEPDELAESWQEVAPELADHIDKLSPEEREGILLKRLQAAQSAGEAANTETSAKSADSTSQPKPKTPPVEEIPAIDFSKMQTALADALADDSAAKVVVDTLKPLMQSIGGLASLVTNTLDEQDQRISSFVLPAQFKDAVAEVDGATAADIPAARKIMDEKRIDDPQVAITVAVFRREKELSKAAPKRVASKEAKRKAEALRAAQQGGQGQESGAPVTRMPRTEEEWKELLQHEQQQKEASKQ